MLSRIALISLHASPLDQAGQNNAGGLNVYIRALSAALAGHDLSIDIFTRRTDTASPDVITLSQGVRVIQIDAGPLEPLPPDDLLPFVSLFTAGIIGFAGLQEQTYDLIHSHYWLSGLAALRLRPRWRVPMVHMFHTLAQIKREVAGIWSPADQRRALLEQQVLSGADVIVAANALEAAHLRRLYDARGIQIHAIPCGVDLDLFTPGDRTEARHALGLPLAAPIVLAAARIEPLKDLGTAVRAVGQLESLGVANAHLVITGGPVTGAAGAREMERLCALAREARMEDRLHLVGAVARGELPLYMAAADAVIVPSLYESFGMVALEALACGRPVVASAAGGLRLTVHDGENGYLAPVGDAPAFAARLAALLGNPMLARRLSLAAQRGAEPYGWPVIADRMLCLFESLTRESGREVAGQ